MKLFDYCCVSLWALASASSTCLAQISIDSPPTVIGDRFELNAGETLSVSAGGEVGHDFRANDGSIVNISGGNVGLRFFANSGSEVNISGGNVGSIDNALVGSIESHGGSVVNLSGGTIGDSFQALPGSEVRISGGTLGREVNFVSGSDVEIVGGEFRLNGVEFTDNSITLDPRDFDMREAIFTGTLADGSTFIFTPLAGGLGDKLVGVTLTAESLPHVDLTRQVINSTILDGPSGLRAGQSMTVQAGGALRNNFAMIDATLDVEGGRVGRNLEVVGSDINITGGNVGDRFFAYSGSEVSISGGSIGFRFEAFESAVTISGGNVGSAFIARSGSVVNISGGSVGSLSARPGSVVNIIGGTVGTGGNTHSSLIVSSGSHVNISGGTIGAAVDVDADSNVELMGGEFRLNGVEFTPAQITLDANDIFTGTLADGSSFIFSPLNGDALQSVTLTRATIPPLDLTPRIVDTPVNGGPSGLRSGQTLTVQTGGLLRDNFAVVDATLNVDGGSVGGGVEVVDGTVNVSGGTIGGLDTNPNIGNDFSGALDTINSVVNISGGTVGDRFTARRGSIVNMSGGRLGFRFRALPVSTVILSGGAVGQNFGAQTGSDVTLIGNDFRRNGAPFAATNITLGSQDILTGVLSDGSTFVFSPLGGSTIGDELQGVTLTRVTLPTPDLTPRVISSPVTAGPSGLRRGQTLTVRPGGQLGDNFAVIDATLNVIGGSIGDGLEVFGATVTLADGEVGLRFHAYESTVNMSGGTVDFSFNAFRGTKVNLTGGTVGSIRASSGSVVNISGETTVRESVQALRGSEVNIYGGTIAGGLEAIGSFSNITDGTVKGTMATQQGVANVSGGIFESYYFVRRAEVNISGGDFGYDVRIDTDSVANIYGGTFRRGFSVRGGSQVNLFGTQFRLDGEPLRNLEVGKAFTIVDRDVTLSNVLADGTPFSFLLVSGRSPFDDFTVTVTLVPEPTSFSMGIVGGFVALWRRRLRSAPA